MPNPGHPSQTQEAPCPRAPSCHLDSAQRQLARACTVGLVTGPRAGSPPRPRRMDRGPQPRASRTGGWGREGGQLGTPLTEARGDHLGALLPPRQRARTARRSVRCGVGAGSPRPHPSASKENRQQAACPKDARSGRESTQPWTPLTEAGGAPPAPRALVASPQRATPAFALVIGPHARAPLRQRRTDSGPGPRASRTGGWGSKSAQPRRPLTEARSASLWAPWCRPDSAPSQFTRACAVALVTGPQARNSLRPLESGQRAPADCPKDGPLGECQTADTPHGGTMPPPPPPQHPHAATTARIASSQEGALWGW